MWLRLQISLFTLLARCGPCSTATFYFVSREAAYANPLNLPRPLFNISYSISIYG